MRAVLILELLFFFCLRSFAQPVNIHGQVSDDQGKPIAFASIWIYDSASGTVSNQAGQYRLNLKPGTYTITFGQTGFEPLTKTITVSGNDEVFNAQLFPITLLNKKADSIINQVIAHRRNYSKQLSAYSGEFYCKNLQQLDGAPDKLLKGNIPQKLNLNTDHTGLFSLSESLAEFHTRSTDYVKEYVIASKLTSDNNPFGYNSAAELHIDLYKNTVFFKGITDHGFVSPIANTALHHYRYRLIGKIKDQGRIIYLIDVKPKHRDEHLFKGTIGIVDQQWLLYSADLNLAQNSRMDFVDSLSIHVQYAPLKDGNWVNQDMVLRYYGKLLGFKYSGYFLQLFQNIIPDTTTDFNSGKEVYYSDRKAYQVDNLFWEQNRTVPLLPPEVNFYTRAELDERHRRDKTLTDSLQNSNNHFSLINYIFNGYTLHDYRANSLWTFPSPYNMAFYNTVEGFGINLFAKYKKIYNNTQHSLTVIPNVRYGFSDHVFNANIFANYVYNPFHQGSVYGRIGSDFLDLNDRGTISPFLNSLSTLFLGYNYIKLYQSRFVTVGTDGEVANGVLLNGSLEYAERMSVLNTTGHTFNRDSVYLTSNNPLDPNGNTPLFPSYRALIFSASATITFDQQYKITPSGKFILPNPYPRLRFNYREGLPILGSDVNYNFVSLDVFQDRVDMGTLGYTGYFLSAGKFLNTTNLYYPDFYQFSGGESFFFNASLGSFHFLNFYTYSTDKAYFEAHLEHNFTGFFLSHVPLLNRLNLQEIVGGSFLTQGTLPAYKEVYFGLKRTVVRLDYGLAYGRYTKVMQGFRLIYNL